MNSNDEENEIKLLKENNNIENRKLIIFGKPKVSSQKYTFIIRIIILKLVFIFMLILNEFMKRKVKIKVTLNNEINKDNLINYIKYKEKLEESNKYNYSMNLKNIYNSTYKNINFTEMNDYIKLCKNGTLISQIPNKYIENPKITVLIPVYNAQKNIKSTIRSAQNQNMTDIEILIIDDNSKDNSVDIIKQLQDEDQRIRLIKNNENRGTLYTRSIGALNAKGKYNIF